MGKSCVRINRLDDAPLDVLGRTVRRMTLKKFIKSYEAAIPASRRKKMAKKSAAEKTAKKKATKKSSAKKAASRRR